MDDVDFGNPDLLNHFFGSWCPNLWNVSFIHFSEQYFTCRDTSYWVYKWCIYYINIAKEECLMIEISFKNIKMSTLIENMKKIFEIPLFKKYTRHFLMHKNESITFFAHTSTTSQNTLVTPNKCAL